jgi:predicted ATP-grasp superfamily ATP-dependent carboligase
MTNKPIAVLYEHPDWFQPLFVELERRDVPFERMNVRDHSFDPAVQRYPYSLVVNRVSAFPSGGAHQEIVLYVKEYLAYLDSIQASVINGYASYLVGASKAMQLNIFERLDVRYPRARVIHDPKQATIAAADLKFPVLLKPNIGGSGTGILRFDEADELRRAVDAGAMDLGIDHVALVQECLPVKGEHIVRVEVLNGAFLYAIRLPIAEDSFNYCPADGCNIGNPELAIESYAPPAEVVETVLRILAAAKADLGSVEYLVNAADDQVYYYDVNPLSNFVADAPSVVGFDPTVKFVDFLLDRAGM